MRDDVFYLFEIRATKTSGNTEEIFLANQLRQLSLTMVMAPNRALQEKLTRDQTELTREIDTTFGNWTLEGTGDEASDAFNELKYNREAYKQLKDLTSEKVLSDFREEAFLNAIDAEAKPFQLVKDSLATWMQAKITKADGVYEAAGESYSSVLSISTVLVITLAIVMGEFGALLVRGIVGPIQTGRDAPEEMGTSSDAQGRRGNSH